MTVVFCLPGRSFSGKFLECWSQLLMYCIQNGITPIISRFQANNIYFVRNMCLGGDVLAGVEQKPFGRNMKYDYIMWIDSDILFLPSQFQKLLNHQKDIVSGVYLMEDGKNYATCEKWDFQYYKDHGTSRFMTPKTAPEGLVDVDFTGMGFMLVKKGVHEALPYPWIRQRVVEYEGVVDMATDDMAFCMDIKEKGYKVLVDTSVVVKHEKVRYL